MLITTLYCQRPFVTLSVSTAGEGGLMGIALDPDYAANRYVYVYYTSSSGPRNRVSRFTASLANPDVADPDETVLLELPVLPTIPSSQPQWE